MPKSACILFLLDWRPVFWSTREEFFRQLSRRLCERGITPVLTVSEAVTDDVRKRLEEAGARLIVCSYQSHRLRYCAHIRRIVRQYSVQAAHVRFFDYYTPLFWLCYIAGIRKVVFTEANGGEWDGRGWKAVLLRFRTAIMCSPLVKAIAISGFVRSRLIAVGIPARKIEVVYNGIDTLSFRPNPGARSAGRAELGANADTIVMLFVSALLPIKRPEIALEVCAELVRRGVDVQLWMVGDGALRVELEVLSTTRRLSQNVRWLGYQQNPQRWYGSADVFLHTTLGEAFGNVLVEAMACGVPVIASRSGAAPELVVDGETGMLVSAGPKEIEELANAVQRVTGDRDRYRAMAASAVKQAGGFTLDRCVERTLAVYDELIPKEK